MYCITDVTRAKNVKTVYRNPSETDSRKDRVTHSDARTEPRVIVSCASPLGHSILVEEVIANEIPSAAIG